ncbi:VCBS domain-containing protein [Xanthobacter autotrophicus]|uniref:VCBS domain-containing protein n=1 Tax=Xanthobacter autotrophicus TaxID=280 RepID=UPI001E56767B|nr:VCBS domain-containing protein [Xanthobacter autotrophicus]UDQ91303.1 VCBS domain-containing protein [Xanthobacter autotrophicus]
MATKTKAPAFGGLDRSKTLAENTVNAGPVVLDSNVTLKNPDGTGFQGGSLTVKLANAGVDDHLSIAAVGGITLGTDAGTGATVVFYNGARIGTETVSGSTITVSFDQPVSDDAATALARAIAYSNPSNTPSAAAHAVTFTAVDAEHSSISATMQLKVKAENDAPVFSNLGPVSSHILSTASQGVVIDGDAHVSNPDGTGFKGGKLTVHLSDGNTDDLIYLSEGAFSIVGTKLYLDGKVVGTVSAEGVMGHDLSLTFKSNVAISDAQMSGLIDQISYSNRSLSPEPQTKDVAITVTDTEKNSTTAHLTLAFEDRAPTIISASPASPISKIASGSFGSDISSVAVSPDATKVAFESTGDMGGTRITLDDLRTGQVTILASDLASTASFPGATDIAFSPDGQKIAFVSTASNVVAGDTNGGSDVFIKDFNTGTVTRVSTDSRGKQISGSNGDPVFSSDGTKMLFVAGVQNLPGDTDSSGLYVKDLKTGIATQIAINEANPSHATRGFNADFSPDGTKLVFVAWGDQSGPKFGGDSQCIYIKDLNSGDVTYVTAASAHQVLPVFSPDGTKIAFVSSESSVVPGGEIWGTHLYLKDVQTGEITCVSSPDGVLPNDGSVGDSFSFSSDGTKIVFSSSESTLPGNTGGVSNIFVADLQTGAITRIAPEANGASSDPVFTPDGAHVIFTSDATNLVANDVNNASDVFMAPIPATSVTSATLTEDAARKTLNAAGTFYFADADAKDTHAVSVAAPDGALGTLTAKVVSDMNGTGAVVWSYVVDETKVEPLAAGQTKVETFALTLDDHHGGTVTQNVSVTLTGTGGAAPMVASFALAPETTAAAAPASGPELWASAMASLSGVSEVSPQLFDVLEKRAAALESAHAHGPAGAFEGAGTEMAHLAAQIDPAVTHVLETLWSDLSGHGAGTASAHQIADGVEAIATHLRDALHPGHAGDPLLV